MSIFGKKPENQSQGPTTSSPAPPPRKTLRSAPPPTEDGGGRSYLGAGCELIGDLRGDGSFECGGSFDGTIDVSGDVVIGHGGSAVAEIKARRISIEGRLQGAATGTEKVEVGASGRIEGDVRAPAVQFAEGAFFEGNVEMRRPDGTEEESDSAGDDEAAAEPSEASDNGDAVAQPSGDGNKDDAAAEPSGDGNKDDNAVSEDSR